MMFIIDLMRLFTDWASMVKEVGLKAIASLSQKRYSGEIWTGFRSGFSNVITFVMVSLTGEVNSNVLRMSGGEEFIA